MLRVGMIGWRGMVGSVLMQRMREENAFSGIETIFFSTSNAGGPAPAESADGAVLRDAGDLKKLAACDILMSCQGSDYTSQVFGPLRTNGWKGYWIDAASPLRMEPDSVIVLDPVNGALLREAIAQGTRTFVGGNCTVSLMVMAVGALFQAGLVEWMTTMTYQAASGAGAAKMLELVRQMECLVEPTRRTPSENALEVDRMMIEAQRTSSIPTREFGVPLAGSLLPWIDR
ncbi:MAG: aspartate-semialdehyde dehydrogenase, partial [Acidobacteriota bacterium]